MFDRVLVPVDGSAGARSAMSFGARLAERWDAELVVLSLLRRGDRLLTVDQIVARQAEQLTGPRAVELRSVSYSVVEDIAQEFDEVERTLLVMATEARSRGAGIVANIAEEVFRHTRKPMILIGPNVEYEPDWPSGSMLICTDGGDFADSIAAEAGSWAAELELRPEVVAVIDPTKVPAAAPGSQIAHLSRMEGNASARLATDLAGVTGHPVDHETLHGHDPARAIVDHARRPGGGRGVGLIAMATHGRTGLDRLAHGSTTMEVVANAPCPVLVSRPRQSGAR